MKKIRGVVLLLACAAAIVLGEGQVFAQAATANNERKITVEVPAAPQPQVQPSNGDVHRFWDKKNGWLFAGVGASRALDYFSTLNMRRRGVKEIFLNNDAVDNHAAFAAIEAAGTGVSMGASYIFHRYGHHKLERWTSIVHISVATGGAARNYSLKTVHPVAPVARP